VQWKNNTIKVDRLLFKDEKIFSKDEQLNLKPSTIKEVVKLFEYIDLHGIDEDLNGRLFENFLTVTDNRVIQSRENLDLAHQIG
jgi:hypothetical protein